MNWAEKHGIADIGLLGSLSEVEKKCKAIALLDAVLIPDWEERYFSFNSHWGERGQERMGSMRNGHGDEYFVLFAAAGAAGKVYCNESPLAKTEPAASKLPRAFSNFISEPAFSIDNASFYFWKEGNSAKWSAAPGNLRMYPWLGFLVHGPSLYLQWVEEYLEQEVDRDAATELFETLTVSTTLLRRLNFDRVIDDLASDIKEIGAKRA